MSLAAHLLGQLTSPSEAAVKAEMRIKLQEALNGMDPVDREIIALRHFEQLSGVETAEVLQFELYNLKQDPKESSDLSEIAVDKFAEMKSELNNWRRSVASSIAHHEKRKSQASEEKQSVKIGPN